MKAVFVNSFSTKNHHEEVNSSFLKMLSLLYDEVICYTTPSSLNILKSSLNDRLNITYKTIYNCNGNSRISELLRYLISAIWNIYLIVRIRKSNLIFFCFNNVLSSCLLNYLAGLLKKKVLICMHGELEYIIPTENRMSFVQKIFKNLTNLLLYKIKKYNVEFLILGEIIQSNLMKYSVPNRFLDHIHSIDHPCFKSLTSLNGKPHEVTSLGTVGTLNNYKGLKEYLYLIRNVNVPNIRFSVVGKIDNSIEEFLQLGVSLPDNPKEPLPKSEFLDRIQQLDFIMFFYSSSSYKLTASGALIDCVKYHKPFISLKNDYFTYMNDKYGPFGLLTSDLNEMLTKIRSEDLNFLVQGEVYEKIATRLSPEYLSKELSTILNKIGFR